MGEFAPNAEGLLAPLTPWLTDPDVSEICLNRPGEVYIEKASQLTQFEVPALNERAITMLFRLIANENAQELHEKKPLLSGSLHDGSRIQIVLPPTAKYPTLSIRRKVTCDWGLDDYDRMCFYDRAESFDVGGDVLSQLGAEEQNLIGLYQEKAWGAFIREAIAMKKNIIISGGTSSGKTTFLNACLQQIDLNERLLLLEDAREIVVPHPNHVSLVASKGDQGLADVTMQDLVQCCLRLRPDRIILGEIRGKEMLDFLGACSTGHEGSITSIHANNPRIAFMRMTQLYKQNNVPSMSDQDILREIHEVVDIIVQVCKSPKGRYVDSVYYKYGMTKRA